MNQAEMTFGLVIKISEQMLWLSATFLFATTVIRPKRGNIRLDTSRMMAMGSSIFGVLTMMAITGTVASKVPLRAMDTYGFNISSVFLVQATLFSVCLVYAFKSRRRF